MSPNDPAKPSSDELPLDSPDHPANHAVGKAVSQRPVASVLLGNRCRCSHPSGFSPRQMYIIPNCSFGKLTPDQMTAQIPIPRDEIVALCRRHNIRHLALFGSVLRNDFTQNSDVDILVEFDPGKAPGFEFIGIQDELSALVGRKVDLNTPGFLNSRIRQNVIEQSETIYGAP